MASTDDTSAGETATHERLRPGPGGLPPGRVLEIQRSRMLVAAIQKIDEAGYTGMSVAEVIGRAKVSRKTFYDVFADREDCFLAAFEQVVERVRTLVCDAAGQEQGWRERVRVGLARLLAFMDEERGLARLCVIEALSAGPRVLQSRARVLGELADVVDRGREVGGGGMREPPQVTAEGIVGAVFAVVHSRLTEDERPLSDLLGSLMSMIVLPYLGARAAGSELSRPAPELHDSDRPEGPVTSGDPLEGLPMRLTYRTVQVLVAIGAHPGANNRAIAQAAGVADQGQISRLLMRLQQLDLIENRRGARTGDRRRHDSGREQDGGRGRGAANAWHLTARGIEVERAAGERAAGERDAGERDAGERDAGVR